MTENGSSVVGSIFGVLFIIGAIAAVFYAIFASFRKTKPVQRSVSNSLSYLASNSFVISKQFVYGHLLLCVDDINKKWAFSTDHISVGIYDYSDLVGFDLDEDGNSIIQETLNGSLTGGALYGRNIGLGRANVKGVTQQTTTRTCSKLQLRIHLDNLQNPQIIVDFIENEVSKSSSIYRLSYLKASEIAAILHFIKNKSSELGSFDIGIADSGYVNSEQSKECPMCAEKIKAKAIVCRFCGHKFEAV